MLSVMLSVLRSNQVDLGGISRIDWLKTRGEGLGFSQAAGNTNERGSNSVVECQLPKLDVAGSTPVSRSNFSTT